MRIIEFKEINPLTIEVCYDTPIFTHSLVQ